MVALVGKRARRCFILCCLALMAAAPLPTAMAQSFPSKPVRMIVPFAPGGPVDMIARVVSPRLSESLAQPVLVDNRAGGGSTIGTELVVRAPADGYTVLLTSSSIAINPSIFTQLSLDPVKDLAPLTFVAASPLLLVVRPALPVRSEKALIVLACARKGEQTQLSGQGVDPVGTGTEDLARHLESEIRKWAKVVKASGARAE